MKIPQLPFYQRQWATWNPHWIHVLSTPLCWTLWCCQWKNTVCWWVMHLPVVVQVVPVWVLSPWERPFSPPSSIPQNIQQHATRLPVARSDCGYRVLSVLGLDLNHRGSGLGLRVLMIRHRGAKMVHFIPDHTFAHISPPPPFEINCPGQRFKRVVCINSTQS